MLLGLDFNDVRQWCEVSLSDKIAENRDTHGAMLPSEFRTGLLEAFGLKEDYARYLHAKRDEL